VERRHERPHAAPAIWELPEGDFESIEVTITDMHYDTGAAPPEGRSR
jgi:hypothetical protein